MANTMPRITVEFRTAAETLAARSARGAVAVILNQTGYAGDNFIELRSAAEIPTTLTAKHQDYLRQAFVGCSDGRVTRVLLAVVTSTVTITQCYAWLATQTFDWLVEPGIAPVESGGSLDYSDFEELIEWIRTQRTANGAACKAILPNYTADDPAVVNFITDGIKVGSDTYDATDYTARIAGILASTPVTRSVTYAVLPEVEDVTRLTPTAMDAAVAAGKLLAFWDGQQVRLGRGVNSMTTVAAGQREDMKKILIMECRDLIADDLRRLAAEFIGQLKNTFDGRLTVLTAVRTYFETLQTLGVVQEDWNAQLDVDATRDYLTAAGIDTADMTDEEVLAYNYGSAMFIRIDAKLLDAIEDISITVNV